MVLAAGDSHIGMKRKTNQDSICLLPQYDLYVVADGMGGHNGGDIASQMSVKIFPEYFQENNEVPNSKKLGEAIKFINRSIYKFGQENEALKGMGTTVTALCFEENQVIIGNVGDSRTYMIHNKQLFQMTRDHSLVQEKLNLGIYDREGAKADPQKNVLTRTVGFEPEIDVDIYKHKIQPNTLFLLCSDGLHGKVNDEDILEIINKEIPDHNAPTQAQIQSAVQKLISQANINGGQDNISVIIVSGRP